jgi:uncharacterized protein
MTTHFGPVLRACLVSLLVLALWLALNHHQQTPAEEVFQRGAVALSGSMHADRSDHSMSRSRENSAVTIDCAHAVEGSQNAAICGDASLAAKDVEMGKLVKEVRAMPAVDQVQFSVALQHVQDVRADCQTDVPCLTLWYDATIDALRKKIDGQ